MALIIDDAAVLRLISMHDAVDAVRQAYIAFAAGRILESPRSNLLLPNGFLRVMSAAWPERSLVGYKEFHRCNGLVRYSYHLFDLDNGDPLAVMDANALTGLRTGACGGLAAQHLSNPAAGVLAVIGSGNEARSQIEAIRAVRDIREIRIYSPRVERREQLAADLRESSDVDATATAAPTDALAGASIVAVATNTGRAGPAFFGEWLQESGTHINSIGSTLPSQREIDPQVWSRAGRIVLDSALLLEESGDAIAATEAGTIDHSKISLLGDVVTSDTPRHDPLLRTLYKSVGSPLQDLAMAGLVLDRAQKESHSFPTIAPFQTITRMHG